MREYFENLYCNKLENMKNKDTFLDTNDLPVFAKFYQIIKKELTPLLLKIFHKMQNHSMKPLLP
jgi:hypothetical protein